MNLNTFWKSLKNWVFNSRHQRWKVFILEQRNSCLLLLFFILNIHVIIRVGVGLNSQCLQVLDNFFSTHFWASAIPVHSCSKMWVEFSSILSAQFYQLDSSHSLVLFSCFHCFSHLSLYGLFSLHVVLWNFVTKLCSDGFHADFLWTFWIKLWNFMTSLVVFV